MPVIELAAMGRNIDAEPGVKLLDALKQQGIYPDAPCGGNGTCGKCRVLVDGREALACQTVVDRDMTVTLPQDKGLRILQEGLCAGKTAASRQKGYVMAVDIGTTSVVCFLLDGQTGAELAQSSMRNPQVAYGADVITRIRAALRGEMTPQISLIRACLTELIGNVCGEAKIGPEEVQIVSVVGNPAMQQLFLGISPENLAELPFAPVLTEAKSVPCAEVLPVCANAALYIIPDISGYLGADTLGCVLATELYNREEITLIVDIGTNGEMVMGNKDRMIACATAAGPALEGANIQWGMRGEIGAIDHVWLESGAVKYSVIGETEAKGICGSGLIDAVAVGLELGWINKRGRILNEARMLPLTTGICLTQEDIRQVQLAKGAICAGIRLLANQLGISLAEIRKVQLAGAFGSFLNPRNACRIGLLPEELYDRIEVVGNAAGSGAKMLACDQRLLSVAQELAKKIACVELASVQDFPRTFAKAMNFREDTP